MKTMQRHGRHRRRCVTCDMHDEMMHKYTVPYYHTVVGVSSNLVPLYGFELNLKIRAISSFGVNDGHHQITRR
jgi:hypothetical protein